MAGIYKYILVRRAAAYKNSIIMIYQVKVLCRETAHGVYVTLREITVIKHSTMYAYKTDFSIAQTTPQLSWYIF